MRILTSAGRSIAVRASNIARMYYYSEFGAEIDNAIIQIKNMELEETALIIELYKIIWAMAKAENMYIKKSTPAFNQWLTEFGAFDITDCAEDLFQEIIQGFTITYTHTSDNAPGDNEGLTRRVISIALKMGLSMDELNELTTQDLVDILHVYMKETEEPQAVRATPAEAEAYFR